MNSRSLCGLYLALLGVVLVSGCASNSRRPAREGPPSPPVAVKRGEARFFDDQVSALVILAPAARPLPGGGAGEGRTGGQRPSGPPPEGRGSSGRGRRDGPSGAGETARGERPQAGRAAVNLPPAQLILTLTNHSAATIEVEIAGFDSELGNFAVRPERLTLAPGGTTEPDPMTSRLGVSSQEIPIKVTLVRQGTRDTQILLLRDIPPATGGP